MTDETNFACGPRARPPTRARAALLAVAAAILIPGVGAAQQPGIVVVRDADTGQLRPPTPGELKKLRAQEKLMLPPASKPVLKKRADGRSQMRLGESAMVYSVVTRGADGKLVVDCLTGREAAEAAAAVTKEPVARAAKGSGHDTK
ncbi:post-PEP-CTERM-1 domain-containing protein [Massilia glaciei]|uniref:Uncharacterized protein n=1 Tax=Massilia glaciei TaxID=1524097 RepID=A0A2U2HDE5_9BURK|nr:hypothetical protein [Massilia glaciei]PWF40999.1 hypothetical protein C7C56_025585 [Massilia glaciei]